MENKEEIKRIDGKYFLIRELETNGEPINIDGEMLQPIKPINDDDYDCQHCCLYDTYNCGEPCMGGFFVRVLPENGEEKIDEKLSNMEITGKNLKHDNKENMEEKKLNLKPFDLEAAKAGKPVCTRDGRKVRIICFDSKNDLRRPIVALVEYNGNELLYEYTIEGKDCFSHISTTGTSDLMMLPEKKEGWVNVYKGGLLDTKSYPTKKEAFDRASSKDYITTVKIEWEE